MGTKAPKLLVTHLCLKQGILAVHETSAVFRPGAKLDTASSKFSATVRMLLQKYRYLKRYPHCKPAVPRVSKSHEHIMIAWEEKRWMNRSIDMISIEPHCQMLYFLHVIFSG